MRKSKRARLVRKIEKLEAEGLLVVELSSLELLALRGLQKNCNLKGKRFIPLEDFHRKMPEWDLVILKSVLMGLVAKHVVVRRDSVYVSGRVLRFGLRNLMSNVRR